MKGDIVRNAANEKERAVELGPNDLVQDGDVVVCPTGFRPVLREWHNCPVNKTFDGDMKIARPIKEGP